MLGNHIRIYDHEFIWTFHIKFITYEFRYEFIHMKDHSIR